MSYRVARIASAAIFSLGIAAAPAAFAQNVPQPKESRTTDPAAVKSGDYVLDQDHGRILWEVSHHGYSRFFGLLPIIDATLTLDAEHVENSKLHAVVHMDKVISAVPADHFDPLLKSDRVFNVEKYPTATFTSTKIERTGERTADITGDMTFMGVTKPAVIHATFNQSGEGPTPGYKVGFDGTMTFDRTEFGLTVFSPSISNEVTLKIEAEFNPPKN